MSRGTHSRENEAGYPPRRDGSKQGEKAAQHDVLIQMIMAVCELVPYSILENAAAGLCHQEYMDKWKNHRQRADLCAFNWPFKKAADLWIRGVEMPLCGTTGTGRCDEACGQGMRNPMSGSYEHFSALGVEPEMGPRGKGAGTLRHGLPPMLLT